MAHKKKSYVKDYNLSRPIGHVLDSSETCPLPDGFSHLRGWIVYNTITKDDRPVALQLLEPASNMCGIADYDNALKRKFKMASQGHHGARIMTAEDAQLIKANIVDNNFNDVAKLVVKGEGRGLSYWIEASSTGNQHSVYHLRQGQEYSTTKDDQARIRLVQDVNFDMPATTWQRFSNFLLLR